MSPNPKVPQTTSIEKVNRTTSSDVGSFDDEAEAVPARYRGTADDKHDMSILGKKQVLRRNFRFVTMLGFASTAMASWEVLLPQFVFVLTDGGLALLFWGFIAVIIGQSFVYASIAEMASISPTAGGQYHWVSEFAPPRYQKILSYITGWLTAVGWQVYLAGSAFMTGTIIQGLIALNNEDYVFQRWHGTLLTIAIIILSVFFNTALSPHLSVIEGCLLVLHILGLFAMIIPLWVTAPIGRPKEVLLTFTNDGGWPTTGLSAMIGLAAPIGVFIGYDCSVHMSEEVRDASRTMPKAIMWSCAINFVMAFLMGVTLIFCVGDIDSVLSTSTGQPFIQLIFNATQSYAGTNTMVAILVLLLTGCTLTEVATSSRQIWSFSRDGGLPFSKFLTRVDRNWNIPVRVILLCVVITSLLACINLDSSIALNAINSLGGVSILSSYYISISCVIYCRVKGPPLPQRNWSLGRYGLYVNIAALVFLTPVWFFVFWPLAQPVTPQNMNWSLTMFGGVIIIALMYYSVRARHGRYVSPVVHVKRNY